MSLTDLWINSPDQLKAKRLSQIIAQKFGTILTPQEYTRVDGIIDVVFLTAEDVKEEAYAAFGCGSKENVLLIPRDDLNGWLDGLNTSSDANCNYWHIRIQNEGDKYRLIRRTGFEVVDLTGFLLPCKASERAPEDAET